MNFQPVYIQQPAMGIPLHQQTIEHQLRQGNMPTQQHSTTPFVLPATANPRKETLTVRAEDSSEMIRIQAQRIARLEERCDLLTKQYQRYVAAISFKDQEIANWQERCNILQAHLETPYKRIEELQWEKNEVKRDQERMNSVLKSGTDELSQLKALREQKEKDIVFWKERAKKAEKTQTIILSLEHRIKMLEQENERLDMLVVKEGNQNKSYPNFANQ